MFSLSENLFHPFNFYKIGQPIADGDSNYLRISKDKLWVITIEKESFNARQETWDQKAYNPNEESPTITERALEAEEIEYFKTCLEQDRVSKQLQKQKLDKIKAPLKGAKKVDFHNAETISVIQREYAITTSTSPQPVLGTFGAGPCVILALYDSKSKSAILAHIDSRIDINSLPRLFSLLSTEDTVAHLFGGYISSQDMCMDIVELLEKNQIKIVNCDIARTSFDPASLAIDSRTGIIYSPVEDYQLREDPHLDLKLQLISLQMSHMSPLRKCDGTQQIIRSTESQPEEISAATLRPRVSFFNSNSTLTPRLILVDSDPQANLLDMFSMPRIKEVDEVDQELETSLSMSLQVQLIMATIISLLMQLASANRILKWNKATISQKKITSGETAEIASLPVSNGSAKLALTADNGAASLAEQYYAMIAERSGMRPRF
jgi:hypothetical protein